MLSTGRTRGRRTAAKVYRCVFPCTRGSGWRWLGAALLLALGLAASPSMALEAYSTEAFHQSLGMNSHIAMAGRDDPSKYGQIRDALQEIGILYSRGKIVKANVARARDLYDCCGIRTLARIDVRQGGTPKGAVEIAGIGSDLDMALRVGTDALVAFEGPNEYTHFNNTGDWNIDLQNYTRQLFEEVRTQRGLKQLLIGPTVFLRREEHVRAIGDLSPYIDASNFHSYTGGFEPSHELDDYMRDAQIMAPGKPVWVTEYGFHNTLGDPSSNPVSEITSAKYLPRFAALLFNASPNGKHFMYEFVDGGSDNSDREQNFGLLRSDLSKKPAFYAIKRMVDRVKGGTPGLQAKPLAISVGGDTGDLRTVLLQKADKTYVLLLWQEVRSWNRKAQKEIAVPPQTVSLSLPAEATFTLYDTLPSLDDPARDAPPRTIGSNTRTASISVPDHIVMVEIRLS